MERSEDKYDVIIMDIADPIEAGPGYVLYTQEFYNFLPSRLNLGGVFVTQSGPGASFNITECCSVIRNTLFTAFDHVHTYSVDIPSFGSNWAFNLAYGPKQHSSVEDESVLNFISGDHEIIDQRISERFGENILRFYDGETHKHIFSLPRAIREGLSGDTRIMTIDDPIFMF